MRQVGILAAAGIVSLDSIVPGIETDHEKIRRIAEGTKLSSFFNIKKMLKSAEGMAKNEKSNIIR